MQLTLALVSMARTAALFLMAAAFTADVNAMSLRQLRALVQSDENGETYALYYMAGAMEGALEAHMYDVRQGAKAAICLEGRRLEPRAARMLLDTELQRHPGIYEADMPVQFVMTTALVNAYPCKSAP